MSSPALAGGTFPKSFIRFDPRTGAANVSFPGFVAQAVTESRFRLTGETLATRRNYDLIRAEPTVACGLALVRALRRRVDEAQVGAAR